MCRGATLNGRAIRAVRVSVVTERNRVYPRCARAGVAGGGRHARVRQLNEENGPKPKNKRTTIVRTEPKNWRQAGNASHKRWRMRG